MRETWFSIKFWNKTNSENKILFSFTLLFLNIIFQKSYSQSIIQFQNQYYNTYKIKIDSSLRYKLNIVPNYVNLNFSDFIEENTTNIDSDIFLTNACINESNGSPIGLLISRGNEISKVNYNDGNGNFFLKPNGFFAITNNDVIISESKNFKNYSSIINAVQSGPMLVSEDNINPQFNQSSTNRKIRSGVGIITDNNTEFLLFTLSTVPVSFYEFASFYKNYFNCSNALCLESVNSVMYYKNIPVNNDDSKKIVGSYILYNPNANLKPKQNTIKMMKSQSGVFEVPVELNKVLKISFIFDSGASDVSISPDVALTLMRTGTIEQTDFIGSQVYSFADGSTATSEVFILKEIKIGGHVIKNVRASISNSINAPMLLGQSVLQRLGKFSIDNNNHTLIIEE
jgi:clan AA aspartic protease (TIGR02281 family)